LELALKRFLVQRCSRTFVGYPFGIGPLLAFLNLKYFEALDIRTILLGKKEKKSAEALRSLLLSPLRES
jgi:vacuolar-type H+-ATPase subunit C/Vma6